MDQEAPVIVFIVIAALTPLIAAAAWLVRQKNVHETGLASTPKIRRNLVILAVAGPVNLLLWFVVNGWLDQVGSRSVVGFVLAALVFLIAGFGTGFFQRLRHGRRSGRE